MICRAISRRCTDSHHCEGLEDEATQRQKQADAGDGSKHRGRETGGKHDHVGEGRKIHHLMRIHENYAKLSVTWTRQCLGFWSRLHHWYVTAAPTDGYTSSAGSAHVILIESEPPSYPLPAPSLFLSSFPPYMLTWLASCLFLSLCLSLHEVMIQLCLRRHGVVV